MILFSSAAGGNEMDGQRAGVGSQALRNLALRNLARRMWARRMWALRKRVTGAACRLALLAFVTLLCNPAAASAEPVKTLPQDHAYQSELRDYLATLSEADFEVSVDPLRFDATWAGTDEALHRLWLVAGYDQRLVRLPDLAGLLVAADNFVLSSIESTEGIMMRAGHRGGLRVPGFSIQPADTAWWSLWDYPGNPYFGQRAVRNRAFAVAAVDMIMLDHLHESGTHWVNNARRSDFLGGALVWLAYVYHVVKDDLPPNVQLAYETGLAKFVARLTEWGPTRVNDNIDMKTNVGLVYLAATLKQGTAAEQARAYVSRNLKLVHSSGMIRDARGLDASYNGIALINIIWAAAASSWPELIETVRRMSDLKGHLTFPEPDGRNYFGPSHFSTRTGHGSPTDQWSRPYRDIAAAALADEAMYLMYGGRRGYVGRWAAPDRDTMLAQVRRGIDHINTRIQPSDQRFGHWVAGWWAGTINYAHDYYPRGLYARLLALDEAEDRLTLPPLTRPGERFIRAFPDPTWEDVPDDERNTFLVARFDSYAAAIYTGPIGNTRYMNFAGGSVSAFWTPTAGSIVLGRTGHPVHPERTSQTWADWRVWPTHALTGMTPDGNVFTSARLRRRVAEVEYELKESTATAVIRGPIGAEHDGSRTAQNKCITGQVSYERRFEFAPAGITIETTLHADGTDQVVELCEVIPLLIGESRIQSDVPHHVQFVTSDTAIDAATDYIEGVTEVRISRFAGGASIVFDQPQRVRLASETWTDTYQSRMQLRNVHIDLLNNQGEVKPLPSVTLRYHLRPSGHDTSPQ